MIILSSIRQSWKQNGSITQAQDFYPFGEILRGEYVSDSPLEKYKFTGKERDRESQTSAFEGLDYFGARYYDPNIGRFLSVDPLSGDYPSLTPYNYVANNPLIYIDPTGMAPIGPDEDPKDVLESGDVGMFNAFVAGVNNMINKCKTILSASFSLNVLGAEAKLEHKVVTDENGQVVEEGTEGSVPPLSSDLIIVSENSDGSLELSNLGAISTDGEKFRVGTAFSVDAGVTVKESRKDITVISVKGEVSAKKVFDIKDYNEVVVPAIENMMKPHK